LDSGLKPVQIGKGRIVREGSRIAILAFGSMVAPALAAAKSLDATVADMRWVKPLDTELVEALASRHELLVTVEENAEAGGAGSAVTEWLARRPATISLLQLGLPDRFSEHGDHARQLAACGLDAAGIETAIRRKLAD
jgi:1-deoxy-D-xylulose-5-phosphate synthase